MAKSSSNKSTKRARPTSVTATSSSSTDCKALASFISSLSKNSDRSGERASVLPVASPMNESLSSGIEVSDLNRRLELVESSISNKNSGFGKSLPASASDPLVLQPSSYSAVREINNSSHDLQPIKNSDIPVSLNSSSLTYADVASVSSRLATDSSMPTPLIQPPSRPAMRKVYGNSYGLQTIISTDSPASRNSQAPPSIYTDVASVSPRLTTDSSKT